MAGASTAGSQTLARGLRALRLVVASPDGLTPQDLASELDVHRTIAYRLLQTLAEARMVARGTDGVYRGSVGLLSLQPGALVAYRRIAGPIAQRVADQLAATVSVLVNEGDEAVAIIVAEPRGARYRISFAEGSTHPLGKGAAGHALSSLLPPKPGDSERLTLARTQGWARSFGEVEPGAHGVAVPVPPGSSGVLACLNLITYREDIADTALDALLDAARELSEAVEDQLA